MLGALFHGPYDRSNYRIESWQLHPGRYYFNSIHRDGNSYLLKIRNHYVRVNEYLRRVLDEIRFHDTLSQRMVLEISHFPLSADNACHCSKLTLTMLDYPDYIEKIVEYLSQIVGRIDYGSYVMKEICYEDGEWFTTIRDENTESRMPIPT